MARRPALVGILLLLAGWRGRTMPIEFWLVVGVILVFLMLIGEVQKRFDPKMPAEETETGSGYMPGGVDVSVLRIALDARARAFVETQLASIVTNADNTTGTGRVRTLQNAALVMR